MPISLVVAGGVFAVLAAAFGRGGWGAVRGRRWLRGLIAGLSAALFASLAALAGVIAVGVQGYRALTHEVLAATVRTDPLGPQRFRATITLADSSVYMYDLAGDALYVDAHILKWHPLVNILGLHTAYELDRVSGRYDNVADERARPRTVYKLAEDKPVDAFELARLIPVLPAILDARYGSATFVGAREAAVFEVRVSTTGLLVRRKTLAGRPRAGTRPAPPPRPERVTARRHPGEACTPTLATGAASSPPWPASASAACYSKRRARSSA